MATIDSVSREYPGAGASRLLLRTVLERYGPRDFALELWDGEHWPAQLGNRPRFELILRSPSVVRGLFSQPDSLSFGEAFVYNQLDIRGSLLDIFAPADRLMTIPWTFAEKCRLQQNLWSIPPAQLCSARFIRGLWWRGRAGFGAAHPRRGQLPLRSSGGVLAVMAGRIVVLQLCLFPVSEWFAG